MAQTTERRSTQARATTRAAVGSAAAAAHGSPEEERPGLIERLKRLPTGWRLMVWFVLVFGPVPGLLLAGLGLLTGQPIAELLRGVLGYEWHVALYAVLLGVGGGLYEVLVATRFGKRPAGDMAPWQERSVFVAADASAARSALRAALGGSRGEREVKALDGGARFEVRTRGTLVQPTGTVITAELAPTLGGTLIHLSARPVLKTLQVDGSLSRDDVEGAVSALLEAFPGTSHEVDPKSA